MAKQTEKQAITNTIIKSMVLVCAMFVFAIWVMPPLYDLFCEVTGLNGKTKGRYEAIEVEVDTSRLIKVKFVATNNESMPWKFKPQDHVIEVHPGQAVVTNYIAHNLSDDVMVGQAVPSLVPHNATDFFHKTECFCFNQQVLGPGEEAELGLQFIVDQDVPRGVNTIILSYTLFDVTANSPDIVKEKIAEIELTEFKTTALTQ